MVLLHRKIPGRLFYLRIPGGAAAVLLPQNSSRPFNLRIPGSPVTPEFQVALFIGIPGSPFTSEFFYFGIPAGPRNSR